MWRFFSNVSRAIKSHVHSPRPSAGLYVEEEQEVVELNQKATCPFTGRRRRSVDDDEHRGCRARILNNLFVNKKDNHSNRQETTCKIQHEQDFNTGQEENKEKKWSCHHDFWRMFQGSHRVLEAISWGSAVLFGAESERLRRRNRPRFLWRILLTSPSSQVTVKSIKSNLAEGQASSGGLPVSTESSTVQISTENPAQISSENTAPQHGNPSNTETEQSLDSALGALQSLCTEYSSRTESLLGIQAATKGDFSAAAEHFHMSCELGNMSACFNLALCYETGSGVKQDFHKAKYYYQQAAAKGHSMALYNLALLSFTCSKHMNEERLSPAGAAIGCECCIDRGEGLGLLEKAAELGLAQAQTYLGIHHIEENDDMDKAVPYFQAAAQQNDIDAQYFLAICYEQGWGVKVNECRAAQLYSQAAGGGHDLAMYNLAMFNELGLGGLPEDKAAAKELYQKAADLGCQQAKQRLQDIKESTEAEDKKSNYEIFHELYLQYHNEAEQSTSVHHSSSLSPSVSSPNLTDNFHKDVTFLFGHHLPGSPPKAPGGKGCPTQPSRNRNISLGSDGGYDNSSSSSSSHHSAGSYRADSDGYDDSATFDMFLPGRHLHKSQSFPNFPLALSSL